MNWIERFLGGIKRLIYGSTSYFVIRQDSCALSGKSFVKIFKETLDYPISIIAVEFLMEQNVKAEYCICINGEKVFPFNECNEIENGVNRSLIPIDIAAGERLSVEVRGVETGQKNVIILNELNIIEKW